ncbi:MAG: FecR domain-containing protein [Tannerella sp.]|jgi:ferric-dicitrate binding protein FerR (iron transport regulator)|nr:FecR domain-containing protein [Tannerella sp.]
MDQQESINSADELLFRCLEGVADDAEYEQAWQWVHQSPQNREYYGKVRDAWIAADLMKPSDAVGQRQAWLRLEKKIQPNRIRGKAVRIKYMRWVAAAAFIVFAYILGQITAGHESVEIATGEYTIEAPKGGKSYMTLIDGSKVWLNAGSTLHFDQSFGEQTRKLTLLGEAYFEVAHDTQRPFMVEASGITIAALGTAFNVKAYPDDNLIETTLVEGSVRIESNAHTKTEPVVLKPNQKVVFYKDPQTLSVQTSSDQTDATASADEQENVAASQSFSRIVVSKDVDVKVSTSWKDKRWIVQGERLDELAVKIERKYDVVLVFEDPELKDYKISATLEEETIEQLLDAIRFTIPMDYRIERNQVYVRINQQLKTKYDRLIQNK